MVRDVAPGAEPWIELLEPPEQISRQPRQPPPAWRWGPFLPEGDREQVDDRVTLDHQSAVHIGFTQLKIRGRTEQRAGRLRS